MKQFIFIACALLNYYSFSQSKNVLGIAMSDNKPLPLFNVLFVDSNNQIIGGNTSDFEGKFTIALTQSVRNVEYIVGKSQCTINDTIRDFNLLSDTLLLNFQLKEIDCFPSSFNDCPKHDSTCEVYRAADLLYHPYDQIDGEIKNDLNQTIPVKYRKAVYTQNGCCLMKWYCKTHDVDF